MIFHFSDRILMAAFLAFCSVSIYVYATALSLHVLCICCSLATCLKIMLNEGLLVWIFYVKYYFIHIYVHI